MNNKARCNSCEYEGQFNPDTVCPMCGSRECEYPYINDSKARSP